MINCLNGFDNPVKIEISENKQIGQIISRIKEQFEINNEYTIENHKNKVKQKMTNRNYTIDKWMNRVYRVDKRYIYRIIFY